MATRIKIECKECGGDIGDVVHLPEGGRAKKCRCCGHETPMLSRTSKKRRELNKTLETIMGHPC